MLELGVPADSADCFYDHFGYKNVRDSELELSEDFFSNAEKYFDKHEGASPCWSVGRLMEIWDICNLYTDYSSVCGDYSIIENYIEHMVVLYEYGIKDRDFNFSKLEEEV